MASHETPRPTFTFRVADVESYLQCSHRLWLDKRGAELSPRPHDDGMSLKSRHDLLEVQKCFRNYIDQKFPTNEKHFRLANEPGEEQLHIMATNSPSDIPLTALSIFPHAVVKDGDAWRIFTVKASTAVPEAIKANSDHLFSAALLSWGWSQIHPETACRSHVLYLNKSFQRPLICAQEQDLFDGLFVEIDATDACSEIHPRIFSEFSSWLADMATTLAGPLPTPPMDERCKKNGGCAFQDFCNVRQEDKQAVPIDILPDSAGKTLAKKLKARGVASLLDATDADLQSSNEETAALYRRIRDAHISGAPILNSRAKVELDARPYPRYFFDFEGIDFAVPRWEGLSPYTQVTFQWSCHIESAPGVFQHHEFLDLSGDDPSLKCIESMLAAMPPASTGPIFVYHATYEKSRMKELAERHPQHLASLESYCARLVDLLPLVKQNYYHPSMLGSFSIKKVLPTIAPHLDYAQLDGVQDGIGAQISYLNAVLNPDSDSSLVAERQLFRYCRQDTWAMVAVAFFLCGLPIPQE